MVDKLNKISGQYVGSVNNDLNKSSKQQQEVEQDDKQEASPAIECKNLEPDKVMDAMKQFGLHNLNNVMASGNVTNKSISDAMNHFTSNITPEMHENITKKVEDVIAKEFPNANVNQDLVAGIVDELIFSALGA
jgi:hypothetical protein